MDELLTLAQVTAALCHLNRLDKKRETNMASLKRLKEARDALLGEECETSRRAAAPVVLQQSP